MISLFWVWCLEYASLIMFVISKHANDSSLTSLITPLSKPSPFFVVYVELLDEINNKSIIIGCCIHQYTFVSGVCKCIETLRK